MKRCLTFLLTLILLSTVLFGCGAPTTPAEKGDESSAPASRATENSSTPLLSKYLSEEDGVYTLTLPQSRQALILNDDEARYVPYITDALVEEAEKKITEELVKHEKEPSFYVEIWEGYLCLGAEIILPLTPPSNTTDMGCGIDHDHVMLRERVSDQAL